MPTKLVQDGIEFPNNTVQTTSAPPEGRQINSGSGLSGGGNLSADLTLTVDGTVVRTTGNQTIGGVKTFTSQVNAVDFNSTGAIKIANITVIDSNRNLVSTNVDAARINSGVLSGARLPLAVSDSNGGVRRSESVV